ncbi:MAG: hypothetical protein JXR95_14840 [Deltaproteobacteria bacterium]|nr:hypothetical protein [Deltaproteobacteria bacterium]
MMTRKHVLFTFAVIMAVAGCAKPNPWKITPTMDLDDPSGSPSISKVIDGGSRHIPWTGITKPFTSDGVFTTGESMIVRGTNFGRLPTVSVCDKPAEIKGRTQDGGIITRIPVGITPGNCEVVVATEKGTSGKKIKVSRYSAISIPGENSFAVMDYNGNQEISRFSEGDAKALIFSPSSPFLYAAVENNCKAEKCTNNLITVELSTGSKPSIKSREKLPGGKIISLGYSKISKTLTAVCTGGIQIFSTKIPESPVGYSVQKWPESIVIADILKASVSPDGKTVAILQKGKNSAFLIDVQVPDFIRPAGPTVLLQNEKAALLKNIFSYSDGSSSYLTALSGDTSASLVVGYHPSDMITAQIKSAKNSTVKPEILNITKTSLMTEKYTPVSFKLVFHGMNSAEDAGHSKWKRYFYFSMAHSELLVLGRFNLSTPTGAQKAMEVMSKYKETALINRLDEKNNPKKITATTGVYGAISVRPDGKSFLGINCLPIINPKDFSSTVKCSVHSIDLRTGKKTEFGKGTLKPEQFIPPFTFGTVAFQD